MNNIKGSNALREITYIPAREEILKKIRVATYARVSSDSDDQKNSFSAQVSYYTKLIEKEPTYTLVDIYADQGISGVSTDKRLDFQRMMEDARNGKIDKIITKSISRFSRNQLDTINALRELKSLGVSVVFEKESINTENLTSENLISLYSLLAQRESLSISQNVKKSNRARMMKGIYVATNTPYGYRLADKKLQIHDSEAEVVKRIFREYLNGSGMPTICKNLNKDNIPRKDGKISWKPSSILSILQNERYIGNMLFQKTYNEDQAPYKNRINNGELPKYYIKDTHEAIISTIEFELVKVMLQKNKALAIAKQEERVLNRIIKCSDCGQTYKRKITREIAYWVCTKKNQSIFPCDSTQISEDSIYNTFITLYNKLRKNYKLILLPMMSQLDKIEEVNYKQNGDLKGINKQIAELSEQNHLMTGLMSDGILDSALFIEKTDEINQKLKKLKKDKAIILKNRNSNQIIEQTELLIEILEDNKEFITEMDEELFEDIIEKITAKDSETLDFHLINGIVLTERIEKC